MDPLSTVGAVASVAQLGQHAFKLGRALYKIIDAAKSIDENVKQLALDTEALARACELVNAELEKVTTSPDGTSSAPYDLDGKVGRCLNAQVENCQSTLESLDEVVKTLSTPSQTFLGQVLRQIEFQKREATIDRIRKHIQSHTEALQILLHVASINVAHAAPGLANQELLHHLAKLDSRLRNIEDKLPTQPKDFMVGDDNSFKLLQVCARDALRSGKGLYEASVAGDSVIGAEDAVHNNFKIVNWLERADERYEALIAPPIFDIVSNPSTTFSDPGGRRNLETSGLPHGSLEATDMLNDDDSDVDLIEAATTGFKGSSEAFEAKNWAKAEDLLRAAFESLEQLPRRHRDNLDLFDIQYRLAVCGYHLREPLTVEAGLRSVLAHNAVSDQQRIQMCDAGYLLACLLIKLGRLNEAELVCRSTLKARSRLQGKKHEARFQTLALLSRVYELLQNHAQGEIYASMIPEGCRELHVREALSIQPIQQTTVSELITDTIEPRSCQIDHHTQLLTPPIHAAPTETPNLSSGFDNTACNTSLSPSPAAEVEMKPFLEISGTPSPPIIPPQHRRESWAARVWSSSRQRISRTSTSSVNDEEIERRPSKASTKSPSVRSSQSGETPLHAAVRTDNFPLVHFLLEYHDADRQLKTLNDDGLSPLAVAIQRAGDNNNLSLNIIRALLSAGGDLSQKHIIPGHHRSNSHSGSSMSFTPRDIARNSNRRDLIEELNRNKDKQSSPQAWYPQIIHQ
ncbi:hypothetical protein K431DRAFT_346777 [Polychaeton citri CBS 116435]|uniref:Ankyrin repeat protein n=1 Tax=Polychaeton citri CBS 116435 TaxID=1314669 RepID=A0A9P4Q9M2_9PEZI|nr:hypothetical protein K431DRAFT_346777 [Polychaeton citri CBS 116435]